MYTHRAVERRSLGVPSGDNNPRDGCYAINYTRGTLTRNARVPYARNGAREPYRHDPISFYAMQ